MKKPLLFVSALIMLSLPKLSAQLINADFEQWHTDPIASATKDPNSGNQSSGWWDFNLAHAGFIFDTSAVTVYQDSLHPKPEHGSYYAAIVSEPMRMPAYNFLKDYNFPYPDTNGLIVTAYVDVNLNPASLSYEPGIPFSQKIDTFSFWYRYIPNGTDTCSCTVILKHYSNGASYTIGEGLWTNHNTVSSWTKAGVHITYDSVNSIPDTMLIQFSACSIYSKPKAGDTMDVDNAGCHVILGVDDIAAPHDNVMLYPNPAQTKINLAITGNYEASHIEVYDITGKAMGIYTVNHNFLTINTLSYPDGLYIYKLLDNTGLQLNVGKFGVVK